MIFQSFRFELQAFFKMILTNPSLHSRWLNTLSYWENCGARKLAAYQHPTKVEEEMLKHAAEEFRHAHILKQQIRRLQAPFPHDYSVASLIGGVKAYQLLHRLEVGVSRILVDDKTEEQARGSLSYLLVTYAIEKRAEEVYSHYHEMLKSHHSPVRITSILLEEKEHLAEITEELFNVPNAISLCEKVCKLESALFENWFAEGQSDRY